MALIGDGGMDGRVKAVETSRPYAVELRMGPVRDCVTFPLVYRTFQLAPNSRLTPPLTGSTNRC